MRSWLFGVALLLLSNVLWIASIRGEVYSLIFATALWSLPGATSLLVTLLDSRISVLFSASLCIPASIMILLTNLFLESIGYTTDFSGAQGYFVLFLFSLVFFAVTCLVGAGAGKLILIEIKKARTSYSKK